MSVIVSEAPPSIDDLVRKLPRTVTGQNVVVIGLGKSGIAAARLCTKKNAASVVLQDKRDAVEIGEEKVLDAAKDGLRLELGGHRTDTLLRADLIVVSPGVPRIREIDVAVQNGVPAISEIELASWFIAAPVLGVTGTNGKSTVTALAGEMVKASGIDTFVGGNLGTPLSDAVDTPAAGEGGAIVIELSSYQLERTYTLRPTVAVLINVTPDHLDRYASLADYAAAKQRIFMNQVRADHAVVPGFDPAMVAIAAAGAARVHTFGTPKSEVKVEGNEIVSASGVRFALDALKIRGRHNVENAMTAMLAAELFGASATGIQDALAAFEGLPHRMQWVAEDDGIVYYNDSKATNVGATMKALEGVDRRVVLIGGGRHKGGSYGPLKPLLEKKGRALVLIGEAAEIMKKELDGVLPIRMADDMFDAVRIARSCARKGDAVLLAPACSSLDMFENYEERGRVFTAAVMGMVGTERQEEDLEEVVDVQVDDA